jgi:hypothetical protein
VFGDDIVKYLPEHIKPFSDQLKQFPAGYEKWVYATSSPPEAYQGDVFPEVPFVVVDDDGDAVRGDLLGMVVSNTCDVQPDRGLFVAVAPVVDLEDYKAQSELKGDDLENHIRALTDNKLSQLMFLPETQNFPRSFVDFGKVCSVSLRYFHAAIAARGRTISLSQYGHYLLLIKLAYHLSRPEASDAKRG